MISCVFCYLFIVFQFAGKLPEGDVGSGKPGLVHSDFFRAEYTMNYLLGVSLVPQISVWDGIVMGGGVGISVLGEYRIATENTLFAMPETGNRNVLSTFITTIDCVLRIPFDSHWSVS